jgi:hypothetical protein
VAVALVFGAAAIFLRMYVVRGLASGFASAQSLVMLAGSAIFIALAFVARARLIP